MRSENSLTSLQAHLTPTVVFRRVLIVVGLLLAAHIAAKFLVYGTGIGRESGSLSIFDLDIEQSFGTWFSSILLLGIGLGLLWIAAVADYHGQHWRWLGIIVIVLSCDEVAGLHDWLWIVRKWAARAGVELGPVFHFAWTIPALAGLAIMVVVFAPFLLHLPRAHRSRMIAAAACYFGGAVGMEMLGSSVSAVHGLDALPYLSIVVIEETMEMVGLALGPRAVLLSWPS